MALISLVLYGSRARGDYGTGSDVDLFGLACDMPSKLIAINNIKLNVYEKGLFADMANQGSLYVWHLQQEGKIIFDFGNEFRNMLASFKLKNDYSYERSEAANVGWLLLSPDSFSAQNGLRLNTIIYVLRTIVYSFLAERNTPAFSLQEAIKYYNDYDVVRLWTLKAGNSITEDDLVRFQGFLNRTTGPAPTWVGNHLDKISKELNKTSFAYRRCRELIASSQYQQNIKLNLASAGSDGFS